VEAPDPALTTKGLPVHTGGPFSFEYLVFEGDAFRVVLFKPRLRGFFVGEHLEVIGASNLLAGADRQTLSLRFLAG
jgi:hypothetical protein